MADKSNTLVCKQCGYSNEGERVYCHNCGTKLDRSLLPTEIETVESLKKKQKDIRKAVTPNRGCTAGAGKAFVFTMFWAVVVAALIQIARPPDKIPPAISKDSLLDARPVSMDLEDAMQSRTPLKVTLTQKDINGYLQYRIKSKTTGLIDDEVKFLRAYVTLDEGTIHITTEQTLYGYALYGTSIYKLDIKNKKLVATNVGGSFGRLQIHPMAMEYIQSVFQNLWDALSNEKKLLDRFQSIEVHKDHIDLVTQPEAP